MEADSNGFSEGIALDVFGNLSEGSGENLFVVRNGVMYTTPLANSVLSGITRDSVLTMARHMGIPVVEQAMPRELLYIADEAFFTGTAAEVHPIRSVDRIQIGDGKVGPVTKQISGGVFGDCSWVAAGSLWLAHPREREYAVSRFRSSFAVNSRPNERPRLPSVTASYLAAALLLLPSLVQGLDHDQ